VSSSFGQFDYAGFAKSASYWYRALWLAATDAEADYGRPPLPTQHVVRISQSWQAIPPGPPPTTLPESCDLKAFLKLCPNTNRAKCLACARAHQYNSTIRNCDGVDVWPTICSGSADPEGGSGPQVQVPAPLHTQTTHTNYPEDASEIKIYLEMTGIRPIFQSDVWN
jgi:hypothetical protein